MDGIVRLRLGTAGILGDQAIHQVKNDFLRDDGIAVNLGQTFGSKPRALSKATPVVDIRYGHVVDATGDAIHFAAAHYRNIDDLRHFSRNDLRKMTDVARILGVGKERHFAFVAPIIEIAPNQFANQGSRENRFRIIAGVRRDRLELVAVNSRTIPGAFDSTQRPVPNNNAAARMTRRDEPIDDRIDNVVVGSEKFAAGRGYLDSNFVARRNQRSPCPGYIGLASGSENKPVDHLTHNARIRLVAFYCIRIAHRIHDRGRGRRLRSLPKPGSNGAEENKSYVSHQHGASSWHRIL